MRSVKESRVKRFALAMMLSIAMLLTMLPANMLAVQAEEVDAVETAESVTSEEKEERAESADAEEFAVDDEEEVSLLSAASSYTKEDGANWACARANEGWNVDVDGYYGCQCVDLILAYYNCLVGYHVSGNAKDYASNSLPSGWTRVYSNPQVGDIVVWGAGASIGWGTTRYANSTYGHIGIIKGVNSDGSISTVETNAEQGSAAHYYQRSAANVACYIRPNFKSSTSTVSNNFTSITASEISQNSAKLSATTSLTYITECGYRIGRTAGNMSIVESEYPNSNTLNIWYTASNLVPGVTYYYQFYYKSGSNTVWSSIGNFTTKSANVVSFRLNSNGYYYTNGKVDTSYTGLAQSSSGW